MPLRLRLSLLFAAATALAVVVAGPAFVLQLRVSVDASLDPGLRGQLADLTDDLTPADPEPVGKGTIVQVLAADGRVLASSPAAGPAPLLTAGQLRQAGAGEVSFTADIGGHRTRVLAGGAPQDNGQGLVVAVAARTVVSDVAVDRAELGLLIGGPVAVVLAGVGAWMLAGAALRPVESMRRQAAEISDRDLDRRLRVPATHDEIAALGETMNALLARMQEALARERGFVADAGHELRTPLAILRAELELAARPGRSRGALVDAIAQAGEETDRLIRLAEDLLLLARADHDRLLRPVRLALPDLLHAAARGAGTRAADRGVAITIDSPADLYVQADPDRLRQAVDNLLDNATRHAPRGSVVALVATTPRPGRVAIEVADHGPGFPPDFLAHAFERFHRAGAARSRDDGGTGLGLSIVRAIARAHDGEAVAANRAGGGAVVTIELPVAVPGTAMSASSRPAATPARARRPG